MVSPYESSTFGNSLSLRVDGAIGSMSLSPNGRDAVLAGRKGLFIIDLDDPFTPPRWLHHITSWEVADVQWLPHSGAKPSWCVSTLNQKALLWDLSRPSNNAIQNVLHRHTRAITDIHFHPQDPELLATCSIDTFVFTWDMRTPRRPVNKYAEWRAGATQVKWSSSNPYQIALSHHHSFYLWDSRKGALPLLKIDNAHKGKINGLDFSGSCDRLITCSNDKTIKFWDIRNLYGETPKLTIVIHTDYPVARARRLPFGKDKCCGIMPVRGGENAIHIVNYEAEYDRARSLGETVSMDAIPDYSFKGHMGPMKDFLWRIQHENYQGYSSKRNWKEYQLVTWSPLDFDLKLWPHGRELYDIANYNPLHQVLLELLMAGADDSRSVSQSPVVSHLGTPEAEISEDAVMAKNLPMNYNSYVAEPEISFSDFSKDSGGDLLSKFASYTIKRSHKSLGRSSQLNHLSWISGVRMGRQIKEKLNMTTADESDEEEEEEEEEGPANLGEEISIVGHKFSKLRFEKISVSTGQIEISLRGPLPTPLQTTDPLPPRKGSKTEFDKRDSITEIPNQAALSNLSGNTTSQGPTPNVQSSISSSSQRQSTSLTNANTSLKQAEGKPTTTLSAESAPEQKLVFIRLEIRFPKLYPFLEPIETNSTHRRRTKHRVSNQIRFDIEETYELNASMKKEMLQNLDRIAQFYTNKYHKYCLEPCLRYLLGEKINLDDSLMMTANEEDEDDGSDNGLQVGNENWVDDLIDQHEAAASFAREMTLSGDEDEDDYADLIFANNDKMSSSVELSTKAKNGAADKLEILGSANIVKHDSTPLPKGCGAVWTNTGELVCFFIPKSVDSGCEIKPQKPTDESKGSSLGGKEDKSNRIYRPPAASDKTALRSSYPSDFESDSDPEYESESDDDSYSLSTNSSNDSFANDWDEMLRDDIPSRSRAPGMFRGTAALGRRMRMNDINKHNTGETLDGKSSAYKSSAMDETALKSTRRSKKGHRSQSVVSIIDFKHLIPDKYELACDYRVLGESPDVIARHNSEVAYHHGYDELGKVWQLMQMVLVKEIKLRDLTEIGKDFFSQQSGTSCDFYWGNHPFGHAWLIAELFDYFEKRRNLQMLAMLSCLLFENLSNFKAKSMSAVNVPIHTPYPSLPPRPSIVSMREHSLVSSEEAIASSENLRIGVLDRYKNISRKSSLLSTREIQMPRPLTPDYMLGYESPSRPGSLRFFHGTHFQLDSPPYVENFYQGPGPGLDRSLRTPDNLKAFTRVQNNTRRGSKGVSFKGKSYTVQREKGRVRAPPLYVIEMKNVDLLDLYEERFSLPLLHEINHQKILQYREQYAEMLYTWGLPFHRIKILKFNYPNGNVENTPNAQYAAHECSFGSRYRKALYNKQLLITPITPIQSAKDNAWNSKSRSVLQYCGYCGLIISKRVVICNKCEHIVHSHCAAEWWAPDDPDGIVNECPTGCGCLCLTSEEQR